MKNARARRRPALVALSGRALFIGFVALLIALSFLASRFSAPQTLTGEIVTRDVQGHIVHFGTLDLTGLPVPLAANEHGIFTCPASFPPASSPLAALDFPAGTRIYEYAAGNAEKDGDWDGKRYGFGQSEADTLGLLAPGRTYYVRAPVQISFRCFAISGISGSSTSQAAATGTYVTDAGLREILRVENATAQVILDAQDGIGSPRDLALDAQNLKLYWLDHDDTAGTTRIMSSRTDGTQMTQLAVGTGPKDRLKFDPVGGRLYWIDLAAQSIVSSDTTGADLFTVIASQARDFAIDGTGGRIYWTDPTENSIKRRALTGGQTSTLLSSPTTPFDMILYASGRLYWVYQLASGSTSVFFVYGGDENAQNAELLGSLPIGASDTLDVHALTIDDAEQYIYWTFVLQSPGVRLTSLVRATLNGDNITPVFARAEPTSIIYGAAVR